MKSDNKKTNYLGIVMTFVVTLIFVWAGWEWFNRDNWPLPVSMEQARLNDINAYKNMQRIIHAQEKYKDTDWDKDGEKSYAQFLVQLWRTVTIENEYIDVQFIDKKLAFAMGQTLSVDGYYNEDLYSRDSAAGQIISLNYKNEWAIAGAPESYKKTGFLTFLTDQTGQIFVKNTGYAPQHYPHNPLADGWTPVNSVEELKEYQNKN